MTYYYSKNLRIPFKEALVKVTSALEQQGFGIITSIDMRNTFNQKLGVDFRDYKILGACNPQFAYKAVSLDSHIGLMLPCNLVIQQHENGVVEVSAINPMETMDKNSRTVELTDLATEVSNRLRTALDNLFHEAGEQEADEALPSGSVEEIVIPPITG